MNNSDVDIEWTDWVGLELAKSRQGPFDDFGIYEIRIVEHHHSPFPIGRLAGEDREGIIYIGRSGFRSAKTKRTIAKRLTEFNNQAHSGGQTYFLAKIVLQSQLGLNDIQLEVRASFIEDSLISHMEQKAIFQYFFKFGELPPCNSSMPSLKKAIFS